MNTDHINQLRYFSRKLMRELGMLQLNMSRTQKTPQHWHALIEISREADLTISRLGRLLLLSPSATSRVINALVKNGLVTFKDGIDKREKYLSLTAKGEQEIKEIDEFSNLKIKGAFSLLSQQDQQQIITAMQTYTEALEKNRQLQEQVKILTLSTSRTIRNQIIRMITHIQKDEYLLPVTEEVNACVLKAEEDFYFHRSYNFWYAVDDQGIVIGSIGLKKIDNENAEIKKFFVHQDYRGKGVAQKLMQTAIKAAIKHNFSEVYLGTVTVLQAAHRFYEKYGFSRIKKNQLPKLFKATPIDTVFFKAHIEQLKNKM